MNSGVAPETDLTSTGAKSNPEASSRGPCVSGPKWVDHVEAWPPLNRDINEPDRWEVQQRVPNCDRVTPSDERGLVTCGWVLTHRAGRLATRFRRATGTAQPIGLREAAYTRTGTGGSHPLAASRRTPNAVEDAGHEVRLGWLAATAELSSQRYPTHVTVIS